ncbi:hypothetical protein Godav_010024 [Gossypium davidsonii]|uniref:Reverse transcriptase zinc-binding domain-containing protein n=1 Tax=Gossypium davidsonii TaxID=34287 RepID=A0A7J8SF36_GOSDV|nr:hypothetical protein [Gossypium davidsonii]
MTCPICENSCETLEHVFRDCVTAKEVWGKLEIGWLQNLSTVEHKECMTYLLENGIDVQRRLIIGAIWAIWTSRNRVLHETHNQSAQEIVEMEHKRVMYESSSAEARWDGDRLENNNQQMHFTGVCDRGGCMFPSDTDESRSGTPKG